MTTFFCLVMLAGVVGAGLVADVWARRVAAGDRARPAPRVVENVRPPASVNAFMGREPDTSVAGYAIWVKGEELYWCPYVRPATPVDGEAAGS